MEKTIFTFTTKNGVEYEYRKADGIKVAVMGCWKFPDQLSDDGYPLDEDDMEFDDFIDLYITDDEFYNLTDENLNNEYKNY